MFNPVKEVNKNVKNTIMADKCVISHEKAEERKKKKKKKVTAKRRFLLTGD